MSEESRQAHEAINEILASGRIPDQLAATVLNFLSGGTDAKHMLTLLEAYLRHPEWEPKFEHALASEEQFNSLSDTVASLISAGAEADQVRFRLEAFHLLLMSQDRDADDDVVLEVLDELTGF